MVKQVKAVLKNNIIRLLEKKYYSRLQEKTVVYDTWIREKEGLAAGRLSAQDGAGLTIRRVPYEVIHEFMDRQRLLKEEADICLFLLSRGRESSLAEPLIIEFFLNNREADLVYGDEDVKSPRGIRYTPWFKPDWSPDTFLSAFYFGSLFAVRTGALKRLSEEELAGLARQGEDAGMTAYRLCFLLAQKGGGFTKKEGKFPAIGHIDEILFHSCHNVEMEILKGERIWSWQEGKTPDSCSGERLVSVIIPSRDNAGTLKSCIRAIQTTAKTACEIIVVDNGSCEETRKHLTGYLKNQNIHYIYEKQPFNFSRMCNTGAKAAAGEVLLFCNDDVEAAEAGWLERLCAQAMKPYAGAAGVKLLYPESDRIQHAGIVNLRLGPVHKLQFMKDNTDYYYGWNRGTRNVLAVTGACLAVRRTKFWEAGGFPEELPVAFNDVALCFSLYEKGYYNAVIQDCFLYHHESLSRGQDVERDKLKRLLLEKQKLYMRHRNLYGRDPFYHKYLSADMQSAGFDTGADYEWTDDMLFAKPKKADRMIENAREDACVITSLEYAGTLEEWKFGQEEAGKREKSYYIQGYAFVAGSNNACYQKKILLGRVSGEGTGTSGREFAGIFVVDPEIVRRIDVERNLPDQVNVGLTGFRAKISSKDIEAASYRIGILAIDRCSGQRLFSWTNRYLHP